MIFVCIESVSHSKREKFRKFPRLFGQAGIYGA
jgi:hypothetical protein